MQNMTETWQQGDVWYKGSKQGPAEECERCVIRDEMIGALKVKEEQTNRSLDRANELNMFLNMFRSD